MWSATKLDCRCAALRWTCTRRHVAGWSARDSTSRPEVGLPEDRVFFAETKQGKLDRIRELDCSHYIDDLPEFLLEPGFPAEVERILFDPWQRSVGRVPFTCVSDWETARRCLLSGEPS